MGCRKRKSFLSLFTANENHSAESSCFFFLFFYLVCRYGSGRCCSFLPFLTNFVISPIQVFLLHYICIVEFTRAEIVSEFPIWCLFKYFFGPSILCICLKYWNLFSSIILVAVFLLLLKRQLFLTAFSSFLNSK